MSAAEPARPVSPPPPWLHRSTAEGSGALTILELFGAGSVELLESCLRRRGVRPLRPERAALGVLVDHRGEAVDQVVVAHVPASGSWCGLDGWSVSCHGGAVAGARVERRLTELGASCCSSDDLLALGVREGGIDRLRADAFAALLRARTERAARYFLRLHSGELSAYFAALLADLRAGRQSAGECLAALAGAERAAPAASRLDAPLRLLLAGAPNAGKSTLFNRLLGAERVVVAALPGTTRDLITETIEIAGYPVLLTDSAGLRSPALAGAVERLGMARVLEARADAVLLLRDNDLPLSAAERALLAGLPCERVLHVRTKADVGPTGASPPDLPSPVVVSSVSGVGLAALRETVRTRWLGPPETERLPPLPFLSWQVRALGALRERLEGLFAAPAGADDLDAVRRAFIECLELGREFPEYAGHSEAPDTPP